MKRNEQQKNQRISLYNIGGMNGRRKIMGKKGTWRGCMRKEIEKNDED